MLAYENFNPKYHYKLQVLQGYKEYFKLENQFTYLYQLQHLKSAIASLNNGVFRSPKRGNSLLFFHCIPLLSDYNIITQCPGGHKRHR